MWAIASSARIITRNKAQESGLSLGGATFSVAASFHLCAHARHSYSRSVRSALNSTSTPTALVFWQRGHVAAVRMSSGADGGTRSTDDQRNTHRGVLIFTDDAAQVVGGLDSAVCAWRRRAVPFCAFFSGLPAYSANKWNHREPASFVRPATSPSASGRTRA